MIHTAESRLAAAGGERNYCSGAGTGTAGVGVRCCAQNRQEVGVGPSGLLPCSALTTCGFQSPNSDGDGETTSPGKNKSKQTTKRSPEDDVQLSYLKSLKMMVLKCCTQYASKFRKLSSGQRTGKGQFSFQSQRRAMPNYCTIVLFSHANKVTLKVLQAGLQQ